MSFALTKVVPMLFPDSQRDEQQQVLQQISKLAAYSDVEGEALFCEVPVHETEPFLASIILHTALQSIHPTTPTTRISTSEIRPVSQPSADVIDLLAVELEVLIWHILTSISSHLLRPAEHDHRIQSQTGYWTSA